LFEVRDSVEPHRGLIKFHPLYFVDSEAVLDEDDDGVEGKKPDANSLPSTSRSSRYIRRTSSYTSGTPSIVTMREIIAAVRAKGLSLSSVASTRKAQIWSSTVGRRSVATRR
jgi:hypothetical protein